MTAFLFNPAKQKLANKELELDADDLEGVLVMENSTADTNRDAEFEDDLDAGAEELDEFDGSGYARQNITGRAYATVGNDLDVTATATVFGGGALGPGTRMAKGLVVMFNKGSSATNLPIAYTDEGGFPFDPTGSRPVTVTWSSRGLLSLRDAG